MNKSIFDSVCFGFKFKSNQIVILFSVSVKTNRFLSGNFMVKWLLIAVFDDI